MRPRPPAPVLPLATLITSCAPGPGALEEGTSAGATWIEVTSRELEPDLLDPPDVPGNAQPPETGTDTPPSPDGERHPPPALPAPPPAPPTELAIREDGRPSWWFSEPRESDGRVALCAEALGPDMRRTRAAAIDAGLAGLRAHLALTGGQALHGMRIDHAWVWPLPNAASGPNRYAGYVLISAERPR